MMGMETMARMSCQNVLHMSTQNFPAGKHLLIVYLADDQHAPLMPEVMDSVDVVFGSCEGFGLSLQRRLWSSWPSAEVTPDVRLRPPPPLATRAASLVPRILPPRPPRVPRHRP